MSKTPPIQIRKYPHDFFHFNRFILRYAGLWAPTTKNPALKLLYNCYAFFILAFVNFWFTLTEFVSLTTTYKDLHDVIKNVNFALTHLMGAVKCVFWHYRSGKLLRILETLESDEFNYEPSGEFQPEEIFAKSRTTGFRYTATFFLLAHMTLSSSYIPPLLNCIRYESSNETFAEKLPYFSWMPFNYDTPSTYLIALGYQAGPMFSYAYSIVGMDTLFMNIMNCTVAHLVALQGAFRSVRQRSLKKIKGKDSDGLNNSEELSKCMMVEMRKCCRHLQRVFWVCEELEEIHKYLTLGQVMATLFILCTSLYLVSTSNDPKQLAAEFVYMVAMCFQLVLYCWFGNEVTRAASDVPGALWECDWLGSTKEFRTCMLFTMLRMKRRLVLTAGEFAPLTLTTFVAILKASYSFFAVLRNTGTTGRHA